MTLTDFHAEWIAPADVPSNTGGYYWFARKFTLTEPSDMVLRVSADSRYNLYLDQRIIGRGPAKGDLEHYAFEEYRQSLLPGAHELRAEVVVWNAGYRTGEAPWSEIHSGGGFLCDGKCGTLDLSTPGKWQCGRLPGRVVRPWREVKKSVSPLPVPPMECFHGAGKDGDPEKIVCLGRAVLRESLDFDPPNRWWLSPRMIPALESSPVPFAACRADCPGWTLRNGKLFGSVPAGTHRVLLDLGRYETGFPAFRFEGGDGSVRIAYAESLESEERPKGEFDLNLGQVGAGAVSDLVFPEEAVFEYTPFWFRSGRFIELFCELKKPLVVTVGFEAWHYPWKRIARIECGSLTPVIETAWHTLRCCTHETFEDCPYYEQLQYVGDTRIQALTAYCMTGDDTLARNAIRQFADSIQPDGLTLSRYPSYVKQVIPPFSLFWVRMLCDHFRHFADRDFTGNHLSAAEGVLRYFRQRMTPSGIVGHTGFWSFTDWTREWPKGNSDRDSGEPEAVVNFLFIDACRALSEVFGWLGKSVCAEKYRRLAESVSSAAEEAFYCPGKGLYSDVPGKPFFSQHANALAIVGGVAKSLRADAIGRRLFEDPSLARCSLYFSFYLQQAWSLTRQGEFILRNFHQWEQLLSRGFTTFPEIPSFSTRSECHGWSSGVIPTLVHGIMGVCPAEPGWKNFVIDPLPLPLRISAVLPLPGHQKTLMLSICNGILLKCGARRTDSGTWRLDDTEPDNPFFPEKTLSKKLIEMKGVHP